MRTYYKLLFTIIFICFTSFAFSQNEDAKALVKQGTALHDKGQYDEAIKKYKQAIELDAKYSKAYYEIAYTLFSTNKGKEAIPFLEKTLALDPNAGGAYDMLGSIYDDMDQPDKAVNYYKQGMKVAPQYQRLYFNMAITLYRQGKYAESEMNAIEAIKLDPTHASSQRIYAMATLKEKKRGVSLLAWCSFLLLEPQTKRSAGAYDHIKEILSYGIKKTDEKHININIASDELEAGNLALPMAVLSATTDKKGLNATDSLTLQLTEVFKVSSSFSGKNKQGFYAHYFSDYFSKLASSGNIPAFARYISLSAYKDENLAWFKEHDQVLKDLDKWVKETPRNFE